MYLTEGEEKDILKREWKTKIMISWESSFEITEYKRMKETIEYRIRHKIAEKIKNKTRILTRFIHPNGDASEQMYNDEFKTNE